MRGQNGSLICAKAFCGGNPKKLQLELTEGVLADNPEDIVTKLTALRERGVSFFVGRFWDRVFVTVLPDKITAGPTQD